MLYNYHTHTFRCHHAEGTEEEYVQRAIAGGVKKMGFSDHFPFRFPNGQESRFRIPMAEVANYVATIRQLKEKYKDIIDIYVGFEMEYYPAFFEEMRQNAIRYGAEYLILGQHFSKPEYLPDAHTSNHQSNTVEGLQNYASLLVEAMKTGAFTYIAHPDILTFTGDAEIYRCEMRRVCVAAREYETPLEINFLGLRTNRFYPHEDFWQIAGEENAPVVFGFDAHDPAAAYDAASLVKARRLVEMYHLRFIEDPPLKPLIR